jgi:hypothetical protein
MKFSKNDRYLIYKFVYLFLYVTIIEIDIIQGKIQLNL